METKEKVPAPLPRPEDQNENWETPPLNSRLYDSGIRAARQPFAAESKPAEVWP